MDKPIKTIQQMRRRRMKAPPVVCGVYFLWKGDELVYVGQSCHIHSRVLQHRRDVAYQKDFDSYSYERCPETHLGQREWDYMNLYKPLYNRPKRVGYQERRPEVRQGVADFRRYRTEGASR